MESKSSEFSVEIPSANITFKAAQWHWVKKELYRDSQEAIRYALQNSTERNLPRAWMESKIHLEMDVAFYLFGRRADMSDLDSLLDFLLNPLVEGICGARPPHKPAPQVNDRLFWKITATKEKVHNEGEEKTIIKIRPIES